MSALAIPGEPRPDTRGHIVATAERLFRDIGYRKTTVADIAKALRMSPANVYRFFDSKKAINEAVAERITGQIQARARAVARSGKPARERMRELLMGLNGSVQELGVSEAKMHEMVEVAMNESWAVIRAHVEAIDAILTGLVREGVASGEFVTANPDSAGPCIRAAMMRFCHPALVAQCADVPRPTIEEQIDFVLAALGVPRAGALTIGRAHAQDQMRGPSSRSSVSSRSVAKERKRMP